MAVDAAQLTFPRPSPSTIRHGYSQLSECRDRFNPTIWTINTNYRARPNDSRTHTQYWHMKYAWLAADECEERFQSVPFQYIFMNNIQSGDAPALGKNFFCSRTVQDNC